MSLNENENLVDELNTLKSFNPDIIPNSSTVHHFKDTNYFPNNCIQHAKYPGCLWTDNIGFNMIESTTFEFDYTVISPSPEVTGIDFPSDTVTFTDPLSNNYTDFPPDTITFTDFLPDTVTFIDFPPDTVIDMSFLYLIEEKNKFGEVLGYSIKDHPMGPNKKWINKNKNLDAKRDKAFKYLEKLNSLCTPITPNSPRYNTFNGIIKRRKYGFSVKGLDNVNIYFINKLLSVKQNYTRALRCYNRLYLNEIEPIDLEIAECTITSNGTTTTLNGTTTTLNGATTPNSEIPCNFIDLESIQRTIGTQTDSFLMSDYIHQVLHKKELIKNKKKSKYQIKNTLKYNSNKNNSEK